MNNMPSMRIIGKEYLDKNIYDEIIMDLASDNRKIKFSCSKKYNFPTEPSKYKYSDDFPRGYSKNILIQDDIAKQVVEHFLNNTTINGVGVDVRLNRYPLMKWSAVESDDRRLFIRLGGFFASSMANDLNGMILSNYFLNRDKYCFDKNNKITEIRANYDCMYYGETLSLPINQNGDLSLIDSKFLPEFLNDRFDQEHYAEISDNTPYYDIGNWTLSVPKYYVSCGDFKAEISENLIPIICPIVQDYNKELKEAKGKQLILKGFE